jgi:threonylcarbamoyladenosine tRNA methylthiotransferase MtaB
MSIPTFALETLGCKVNQYESSFFQEALENAGYQPVAFHDHADIYLVHSCAVTGKAALQTRQLLRRAQRANSEATIVVAGCDAQIEAPRLAAEGLATHILGTREKFDLLEWLQTPGTLARPCLGVSDARSYPAFRTLPVSHMAAARTRAFLKVQDGCDAFCSYCIVPYSRGASRSLPPTGVHAQLERFRNSGHQEVVLTGIHLGQWGKDLQPAQSLVDLLDSLAAEIPPMRLRLSSLETLEWNCGLLQHLPRWPWICAHFHIPLQSGDAEILQRMHRPYSPRQFAEVILELHRQVPTAALGSDVLVGFPGETTRHFTSTLELLRRLPLSYLHVFPYSPRPGTEAAQWPQRVTGAELKGRTRALRDLSVQKRAAFHGRFVGQTVEVLVEGAVKGRPGWMQGTTSNYLRVAFPARHPIPAGSLVRVKIGKTSAASVSGVLTALHQTERSS